MTTKTSDDLVKWLKPSQVAPIVGMHAATVRDYCESGAFKGAYSYHGPRSTGRGPRRWLIPESSIPGFIKDRQEDYERSLRSA